MIKHVVAHLDFLITEKRQVALTPADNELIIGGKIRVPFNPSIFVSRLSKSNLLCCPSADELKLGFVEWLQENKPSVLECAVKKLLKSKVHRVLWTPPYAPDLHPIELFWAGGKNFVSLHYFQRRNTKQTVATLRDGWYGNIHRRPDGLEYIRKQEEDDDDDLLEVHPPVDCAGMVSTAIREANHRLAYFPGISGNVGDGTLRVDPEYRRHKATNIPIDTVINMMTVYSGTRVIVNVNSALAGGNVDGPLAFDGAAAGRPARLRWGRGRERRRPARLRWGRAARRERRDRPWGVGGP